MNIHLQEIIESFCPYCGESIQLLVDCSVPHQEYIEDCQVCCRPMQILANVNEEGIPDVQVQSETD
ncbi:MAG: CPXCG motif-containing cysteine-rich protein [Gammaproteobacteria bacterium]|nr:CPXCG motif-containing cysteine-rich protein [Gammaproteobacteria bacterium]